MTGHRKNMIMDYGIYKHDGIRLGRYRFVLLTVNGLYYMGTCYWDWVLFKSRKDMSNMVYNMANMYQNLRWYMDGLFVLF